MSSPEDSRIPARITDNFAGWRSDAKSFGPAFK